LDHWGQRSSSLAASSCSREMDYSQESRIIGLIIQFDAEAQEIAAKVRRLIPRQEPGLYLQLMRRHEFLQRSIATLKTRRAELEVAA